jgi:hypothetical protein
MTQHFAKQTEEQVNVNIHDSEVDNPGNPGEDMSHHRGTYVVVVAVDRRACPECGRKVPRDDAVIVHGRSGDRAGRHRQPDRSWVEFATEVLRRPCFTRRLMLLLLVVTPPTAAAAAVLALVGKFVLL